MDIDAKTLCDTIMQELIMCQREKLEFKALYIQTLKELNSLKEEMEGSEMNA